MHDDDVAGQAIAVADDDGVGPPPNRAGRRQREDRKHRKARQIAHRAAGGESVHPGRYDDHLGRGVAQPMLGRGNDPVLQTDTVECLGKLPGHAIRAPDRPELLDDLQYFRNHLLPCTHVLTSPARSVLTHRGKRMPQETRLVAMQYSRSPSRPREMLR